MYRSNGEPASAPTPQAEPTRKFLTELTHAMRAAAEHQHEATNAELQAATSVHLERVRARAAAEAEELRRMAQADVDGIHAWQRAEAERIREEAERRILARGNELDSYLVRHGALIDGEVEEIEDAVNGYRARLDAYFDQVTTQDSPAEIAKLADELPEPPDLAKVSGAARVQAVTALAAESEPTNGDPAAGHDATANPALRLFRSIATLAAPTKSTTPETSANPEPSATAEAAESTAEVAQA